MLSVLLVIQVIIAVFLIAIILIQKNNSDGVSGLGGGASNSLFTTKASANILTRTTAILAFCFMVNCLAMATISARKSSNNSDFLDSKPNSNSLIPNATKPLTKEPAGAKNNTNGSKPISAPLAN